MLGSKLVSEVWGESGKASLLAPRHDIQSSNKLYVLETESFYILSFVSFMNKFKDTSRWQFRACNSGLFAFASFLFLFGQVKPNLFIGLI